MMPNTFMNALLSFPLPFCSVILFFTYLFALKKYISKPKTKNFRDQNQLPPGPKSWPLVGCFPAMLLHKSIFQWIHHHMKIMNTDIACFPVGKIHIIPITCPKIAREVLIMKDAIFASRPPSFGTNLLCGGAAFSPFGDHWKKMRKILVSEVTCPAKHRWLYDKRAEEANHLVHYVHNLCKSSKHIDIRVVTKNYCANLTRRLLFNKRYFSRVMPDGGPGIDETDHINALFNILKCLFAFSISDYFPSFIGLDLDGHVKFLKEARRTLDRLHDPIIDERMSFLRQTKSNNDRGELQDWLDVMVSLKDANGQFMLTSEEIKAQSIEFFLASVDNPSHAVEWALAEMINNPSILETAINEIDTVVGKDRLVDECDIPQLNYLKACIKESFRLHPRSPFILPHEAMEDTLIAGHFIPQGSHVFFSRYELGRNPKTWDEPLKFSPERHLTDKCSDVILNDRELRSITFSIGRRGCVGATLGTTMTVMLLARLLQGFSWRKPSGDSFGIIESLDDGMTLAKPLVLHGQPRLAHHLYPN